MTTYRFVQLSDIHFGQEIDGTVIFHDDVRKQLLTDVEDFAAARGPANLVVVVGDIAYSAKESEYKTAGEWLDLVTKAALCRQTDVRVVPGNHDCDRGMLTRVASGVHAMIRSGTAKSAYADLADMAAGAEEAHPLLPKFRAYRDFAAGYSSDFTSVARPMWMTDFPLDEGITLRLVGMNSVQVSDKDDRPGNMVLGDAQYILPEENGVIYAVTLHHPLEWFLDQAEAKQYLHNRVRIILVGHEHIPNVHKSTDMLGNERLDIHSGATSPPDRGDLYRHAYNWIEMSVRATAESIRLVAAIFPRVWVPERVRFAPDIQRLAGRDSTEFEIACSGLKRAPRVDGAAAPLPAAGPPSAPAAVCVPTTGTSPPTGGTMIFDEEAALARLKLLFWRHLDWQQRLKVLVEADALPSTASRPLPQTLERLALENARAQGHLAAVWDAMMAQMPDSRKEANPFIGAGSK